MIFGVFLLFIFWRVRGVLPIWNFVCLDSLSALRPSQCGKQDGKHIFTSVVYTIFLIKKQDGKHGKQSGKHGKQSGKHTFKHGKHTFKHGKHTFKHGKHTTWLFAKLTRSIRRIIITDSQKCRHCLHYLKKQFINSCKHARINPTFLQTNQWIIQTPTQQVANQVPQKHTTKQQ